MTPISVFPVGPLRGWHGRRRALVARAVARRLALAVGGATIVCTAAPAIAGASVSASSVGSVLQVNLGSASDSATVTVTGFEQATVSGTGLPAVPFTLVTSVQVSGIGTPVQTILDPADVVINFSSSGQTVSYQNPGGSPPWIAPQSIEGPSAAVSYGQGNFSPGSATSGLPVSYSSPSGQCSIDGLGLVHITATGTCTVNVSQQGGGVWLPAAPATLTFDIGKAPLFVNAQDASAEFGQTPSLGHTLSGFVNGEDAATAGVSGAASCTATPGSPDPGTYPGAITCTPGTLQAANYDFVQGTSGAETIRQAPQSISFTSSPPSSAASGGSYPVAATGGRSGNPVVFSIDNSSASGACSITGANVSFTGMGSCVIDADQAGNTDYSAAPQAQQTFAIVAAEAPPTSTALKSSANPSLYAQAVTFTATVASSGGTPTGSVRFSDGSTPLGTSSLSGGVATLTVSTLALGSHSIRAAYAGNTQFAGSGSNQITQVVQETPAGLCRLTVSDVETGAKYLALPAVQRSAIHRTLTAVCDQLATITPKLTANQLAGLVAAYKTVVIGLANAGWLTPSQASTLTFLAAHLTIT